jgi:Amt family ammonium transporter
MDMVRQVSAQFVGVAATLVWSATATFVLVKILGVVTGLRVNAEQENEGLDLISHGESAYDHA